MRLPSAFARKVPCVLELAMIMTALSKSNIRTEQQDYDNTDEASIFRKSRRGFVWETFSMEGGFIRRG